MENTEKLIAYIIRSLSGKITKTQLVKLLYLIDVESMRFNGQQATSIKWRFYHYGPWDEELDKRLNYLEGEDIISVEEKPRVKDPESTYFLYSFTGHNIDYTFNPATKQITDIIVDQFGSFTLDSLLRYVYEETEPMRGAQKGEYIDLKKVVNGKEKK